MGYSVTTSGTITVDPPLGTAERTYLSRINRSTPKSRFMPGFRLPWTASRDGTTLTTDAWSGTKEPIAEWASYLRTHLLGVGGATRRARFRGFTYDHRLTGVVEVSGQTHGDRWTLVLNDSGVWVHRTSLPCGACWAGTLLTVRPSNAYRFTHPVRSANVIDDSWPRVPQVSEDECLTRTWRPRDRTWREITWPWAADVWGSWWIDRETFPDARGPHADDHDGWDDLPASIADIASHRRRPAKAAHGTVVPFPARPPTDVAE